MSAIRLKHDIVPGLYHRYKIVFTANGQSRNCVDEDGKPWSDCTRTVIVADQSYPVITLIGPKVVQLQGGNDYDDPGATGT